MSNDTNCQYCGDYIEYKEGHRCMVCGCMLHILCIDSHYEHWRDAPLTHDESEYFTA